MGGNIISRSSNEDDDQGKGGATDDEMSEVDESSSTSKIDGRILSELIIGFIELIEKWRPEPVQENTLMRTGSINFREIMATNNENFFRHCTRMAAY